MVLETRVEARGTYFAITLSEHLGNWGFQTSQLWGLQG